MKSVRDYVRRCEQEAADCRRYAEAANSPLDKEAWLKLAAEWTALADEAKQRLRSRS